MKRFLVVLMVAGLYSCDKTGTEKANLTDVLLAEEEHLLVPNSNVEERTTLTLDKSSVGDYYVSGVVEYDVDDIHYATCDFGAGDEDAIATIQKDGSIEQLDLDQPGCGCPNKPEGKYNKVIVKPLVKSEDCSYIIAGIIMYFDRETNDWVATVDFGDYSCDAIATKVTSDSGGETESFDYTRHF